MTELPTSFLINGKFSPDAFARAVEHVKRVAEQNGIRIAPDLEDVVTIHVWFDSGPAWQWLPLCIRKLRKRRPYLFEREAGEKPEAAPKVKMRNRGGKWPPREPITRPA